MQPFEWRQNILNRYGVVAEIGTRERFLRSCVINGDCWMWARRGRFGIGRKTFRPSEMAYLMLKGPLTEDDVVTTTCKNAKCCSPMHVVKDVSHKHSNELIEIAHVFGTELAT